MNFKHTNAMTDQLAAIDPARGEDLERSAESPAARALLATVLASERSPSPSAAEHHAVRRWAAMRHRRPYAGAVERLGKRRYLIPVPIAVSILLLAIGTGDSPTGVPARAYGAELQRLAELSPHFLIAGPWRIARTESSSSEGETRFSSTLSPRARRLSSVPQPRSVAIAWHSVPESQRERQLLDEGFVKAGSVPTTIHRPYLNFTKRINLIFDQGTARAYVARQPGAGTFRAVALWREEGRLVEFHATVASFTLLERLLERFTSVSAAAWLVALQPDGIERLGDREAGVVSEEVTKVGERPNGVPIFSRKATIVAPGKGRKLHPDRLVPVLYRDGETLRLIERPALRRPLRQTRRASPKQRRSE